MAILDSATRKAHIEIFEDLAHKLPEGGNTIAAEFCLLEGAIGTLEAKIKDLEERLRIVENKE